MATVTSLGFSIFSKFDGKGVIEAKRSLDSLARKNPSVNVDVKVEKALQNIRRVNAAVSELARRSASIKVEAKVSKAITDIRRVGAAITKLSSKSVTVTVNTGEAIAKIDRLAAKLRALKNVTINIDVDTAAARAKLDAFARLRRTIHFNVNIDNDRLARAAAQLLRMGDNAENSSRRMVGAFGRSNTSLRGLSKSFDAFANSQSAALRLIMLFGPAAVAAMGIASVAILQAASAFTIAGLGAGAFGLALRNVINHSKTAQAQVDRLKNAFNTFGLGSSRIIGQVLTHAVSAAINIMKLFEPAVKPVAKVLRDIVKDIEVFSTSPAAKRFSAWFAVEAPKAIRTLWNASVLLLCGLFTTLRKIGAFNGDAFLNWVTRAAAAFNTWANSGGPERIRAFLDRAGPAIRVFTSGVFSLAFAFGKALAPVSIIIVSWLGKIANVLARLINQYPILGQVLAAVFIGYRILVPVLGLVSMLTDKTTGSIIRNTAAWIYNKAVLLAQKTAALAVALYQGIITGSLFRQTAALIRNTAAWIANRAQLVASRAVSIAGAVASAVGALAAQSAALIRNTALWIANTARMIVAKTVQVAIAATTRAWAIAQWLLNAAMLANPFVLIATLIIALGVALVLAYKKSETFRNIVNGAFRIVGAAALWMWNNAIRPAFTFIRNLIGGVYNWIKSHWPFIRPVLIAPWTALTFIIGLVRRFASLIVGAFNFIRTHIGAAWRGALAGLRNIWNVSVGAIVGSARAFGSFMANLFGNIRSWIAARWRGALNGLRNLWNVAIGAVVSSARAFGNFMAGLFSRIRGWIGARWNSALAWIRNTWNAVIGRIVNSARAFGNWIAGLFSRIKGWIGGRWNSALTWLRNIWNYAISRIISSARAFGGWIAGQFSKIKSWVGSRWNSALTWLRNIWNYAIAKIISSAKAFGGWISGLFSKIRNWLVSRWNATWGRLRQIYNFAVGKLLGSLRVFGSWISGHFSKIKNWAVSHWNSMWGKIRGTFNWAWGKIRGTATVMKKWLGSCWSQIVHGAAATWNLIKKAVGRPINFVIGFVNDRLRPGANVILKAVGVGGLPSIAKYKIPGVATGGVFTGKKGQPVTTGFAGGGLMPGYSPGRDNLVASSPIGPVGLSGGEGILRPEVMRVPGMTDFLYRANRMARTGGIHGVSNALGPKNGDDTFKKFHVAPQFQNPNGYAKGGMVANFDGGGIFDKIKNWGGAAMNLALGPLGRMAKDKAKEYIWDKGANKIMEGMFGKIWKSLSGWIGGQGMLNKGIAGGIGKKIYDAVVAYVVAKAAPPTSGDGTWANPSKRLKRGLSWAKSQAGKPYQWGGGGNPSWDCSGFMAGIQNVIMGKSPGRLYTTFDFRGSSAPGGWKRGLMSPFMVGVTNAGVGHMAGSLIGEHVESAGGGKGVNVGSRARGAFDKLFGNNQYGYKPVQHDAKLVGGFGKGGPMSGTIGKSGTAFVGTFWDTGGSGYGDTGAPASGKKMHKFALASRRLIPYGKTAIMQAYGQKRMAAFESIDYGPGITSRLFDIDTYGAAWLFGKEGQWSAKNPGKDVSPGVFRVHWKKGYGKGGRMAANQAALVGERGAEVMVPNTSQRVFKSGSSVSVGDTHVHFHDKVYVKSEREFRQMVVTALEESQRKKQAKK